MVKGLASPSTTPGKFFTSIPADIAMIGACGNGVRRYFAAWLGSRWENGAGKARLCLRGREETRPHAAELGGVLGRGLGEEGGGGRVRRRGAQGAATGRNDAGRVPSRGARVRGAVGERTGWSGRPAAT